MVMLEQLLNTGNCIRSLSNAASSTVAKRVLTSGSTDAHVAVSMYPNIVTGENQ
jgi:hypothetical protein